MFSKLQLYTSFHPRRILFNCLILLSVTVMVKGKIFIHGDKMIKEIEDSEWTFSGPIKLYGIEGVIVSADPPDACFPISGPPNNTLSLNWFVLIAGNYCHYDTKALNSEVAGYSAAIIFNSEGKEKDHYKYLPDFKPSIPVVFVKESSALIIRDNFLYAINNSFRVLIMYKEMNTSLNFFLLFLFSGGIFLFISLLIKLCKYVQHNLLTYSSVQHEEQFQTRRFRKGDPYETCAVCLEDFKFLEKLRILPCLHGYHLKCIDPWLAYQRNCPLCKQTVDSDEIHTETSPLLRRQPSSIYNRDIAGVNISNLPTSA